MLIACVNFVTLAIGRSTQRSTEVGIRKVTGSGKRQLIYQFLAESVLLSIISAFAAILLASLFLPFFNELSGKSLSFSLKQYPGLPGIFLGVVLLTGILSGIYPAIIVSGFKPNDVLKNKFQFSGSNWFTKSLLSFQFVLSIGLIISMIVITRQLAFMHSKDLGLNKNNVVMLNLQGIDIQKKYLVFKQALETESCIDGVAASYIGLGNGEGQMGRRYVFGSNEQTVIEYPVDPEFARLMKIQFLAGRNFDASVASDTINSVIVNESLARTVMGLSPEAAIGKEFRTKKGNHTKTVIGVVKNINFEDLTRNVRPQMFVGLSGFKPNVCFVRISPGNPGKALDVITKAWNSLAPEIPVKYSFLDQKFDDFYKKEKHWSDILTWAVGICIFLACIGLVGLTSLTVVNRTKEIGIRKVNGAHTLEVLILLNKGFVKWIVYAFITAIPIAGYFMNKWLENFAYKTSLSWWIFALSGSLALGIALLTVSLQSWKAATKNPVEALRYE